MKRQALQFDFEWRITLFTLLLFPLLLTLGFWQLERAEEKRGLAAMFAERERQGAVDVSGLDSLDPQALAYLPVSARGEFLPERYFLLDNRTRNRRFGYEVLSPLRLAGSEQLLLVNRGWVEGDPARQSLPDVPQLQGEVELTGHIYVPPGEAYLLAEQQLEAGWPKRLQAVDMALASEALSGAPLFPYTLRINAGQPGALAVSWQVINVSPEKHTGYAVQWFSMAAVLLLLFVLRSSNIWQWLRGTQQKEMNS